MRFCAGLGENGRCRFRPQGKNSASLPIYWRHGGAVLLLSEGALQFTYCSGSQGCRGRQGDYDAGDAASAVPCDKKLWYGNINAGYNGQDDIGIPCKGEQALAASTEINSSLALLIDADNANPKIIHGLLAEVARLGNASVKRIYGDWTTPNLAPWKALLLEHSIQPIQQFRYTTGKNATDSAMIIDAMDLLYTGPFTGLCIVSSDSDFTRLAARIRESGKRVYGFGEQKTPRPFVAACDRFIYTEVFSAPPGDEPEIRQKTAKELRADTKLLSLLRSAIVAASDESGWAHLGGVGSSIVKQAPDFDPRNYGYQKLNELVTAVGLFEVARTDQRVLIKDGKPRKAETVS